MQRIQSMKITYLAYKLKMSPRQLSQMAHKLHIPKYHNEWGEEFFKPSDAQKIIILFQKAARMKISPLFLLSTLTYKKDDKDIPLPPLYSVQKVEN